MPFSFATHSRTDCEEVFEETMNSSVVKSLKAFLSMSLLSEENKGCAPERGDLVVTTPGRGSWGGPRGSPGGILPRTTRRLRGRPAVVPAFVPAIR